MHLFSLVYYRELCLEWTTWSRSRSRLRSWSLHWKPGSGSRRSKKGRLRQLRLRLHIPVLFIVFGSHS